MKPFDFGKDVEMPSDSCPQCGHADLDRATCTTGDHKPIAGDLTVCIYCATVLEFDPDLTLRVAGQSSISDLDVESRTHLDKLRAAIKALL